MIIRRELDQYYTEESVTKYLINHLPEYLPNPLTFLEPCVGEQHISKVVRQMLKPCILDINDIDTTKAVSEKTSFFLDMTKEESWQFLGNYNLIITNPPFSEANKIVPLCFKYSDICCVLLRLTWLEPTKDRAEFLKMSNDYLHKLIVFNPRPSYTDDGKSDSVTTAWFVWDKRCKSKGTEIIFANDWKS